MNQPVQHKEGKTKPSKNKYFLGVKRKSYNILHYSKAFKGPHGSQDEVQTPQHGIVIWPSTSSLASPSNSSAQALQACGPTNVAASPPDLY